MRILITNDDGIESSAIQMLAKWAKQHGEVTVVAPRFEQSGRSQAMDFRNAFEIKKVDIGVDCEAYSVDSTPADCVRYAVIGLKREYDVIISGINRGYNLGDDISYSGTVGAILEAGRVNMRAIALSTADGGFENAMSELDAVCEYIKQNKLFEHASLLNVNFPTTKSKGIVITKQGNVYYDDKFESCGNDMYMQTGKPLPYDGGEDITTDIGAIHNGYVSITPVTAVKTDLAAYESLKGLNK
jgi:5'-nucleotidase